jgi:endonuclease/exonuclease/phosphatase family metal-dependent hydrolase
MGSMFSPFRIGLVLLLTLGAVPPTSASGSSPVRYSAPELLTFDELALLSVNEPLPLRLMDKLDQILHTPFISNEAHYRGIQPRIPTVPGLGPSLRVLLWNIERGVHLDEILLLLTDAEGFLRASGKRAPRFRSDLMGQPPDEDPSDAESSLAEQVRILQEADVLVLNEVDWGMRRSGYREVVRELGDALGMNWAYGVKFVEVDPAHLKTNGLMNFEAGERALLLDALAAERQKLRGLQGTAVLSRYPIRAAWVRPFELQPYDWFHDEKRLPPLERGRRAAFNLMGDRLVREMRRGGRMTLLVELEVPQLPEGRLAIVAPHLENRTSPGNRRRQMEELLRWIRHIPFPVVLAGDLNTMGFDGNSWSLGWKLHRILVQTDFWVNRGIKHLLGIGWMFDLFKTGFNLTKNQSDPTARHIPLVAPNSERGLFNTLRDFRFDDGGAFDFRGDPGRTSNGLGGHLANSNQRASKGYAHTYEFVRTLGTVGKYKLDWIFVKAYLEEAEDRDGPYRFAPHFARTLRTVNFALGQPLSDHQPMTVDLPFGEPASIDPAGSNQQAAGSRESAHGGHDETPDPEPGPRDQAECESKPTD